MKNYNKEEAAKIFHAFRNGNNAQLIAFTFSLTIDEIFEWFYKYVNEDSNDERDKAWLEIWERNYDAKSRGSMAQQKRIEKLEETGYQMWLNDYIIDDTDLEIKKSKGLIEFADDSLKQYKDEGASIERINSLKKAKAEKIKYLKSLEEKKVLQIAKKLSAVISNLEITQVEAAYKMGVNQNTISKILKENPDNAPSVTLLMKFITTFNINPIWLFLDDSAPMYYEKEDNPVKANELTLRKIANIEEQLNELKKTLQ